MLGMKSFINRRSEIHLGSLFAPPHEKHYNLSLPDCQQAADFDSQNEPIWLFTFLKLS